ncbi:ClpP/crotonase-like domain-containing protein [Lipomyces kononenkoae]|uniref:ClpP/crotonase-like domain-containing protein n=1 Tax=Lipomyces kononenkoae TaxID=34357 RepID=A0ACC3SVN2_LIPKO
MSAIHSSRRLLLLGSSWSRRVSTAWSMPLRAKISNPVFLAKAEMATAATADHDDVLFEVNRAARIVRLNRPRKLNALNESMLTKLTPRITEWGKSDAAKLLIIRGEGGKALCAGGDVAALLGVPPTKSTGFFTKEYTLDYILATYPKPIVTFMDGITMGGGAGLCMHTPFRIATEKTAFAMPETLIGFYPDVGASFFLSRLDGELGTYLAVTGERLNGFDAYFAGAATHFVPSEKLKDLEARLAELDTVEDLTGSRKYNAVINNAIDDFQTEVPVDYKFFYGGDKGKTIDACFKFETMEEITDALTKAADAGDEFANSTLDTINLRSPLSMKVALAAVRKGKTIDILETFKDDMFIASKFMTEPDFQTGVSYRLVEKQNGRADWEDASNVDITKFWPKGNEVPESLQATFAELDQLGHDRSAEEVAYKEYPFHNSLPTEKEVEQFVLGEARNSGPFLATKEEVIEYFLVEYRGKIGVREKVAEILDRKTQIVKGHEDEQLINWV